MEPHSLTSNPAQALSDTIKYSFNQSVLEYKSGKNLVAYLPNNNEPNIILKQDIFETSKTQMKEKNWESSLIMQSKWISQTLHPEISDKEWANSVEYSFISKVMTPLTSYLVVENQAQKAILKKKQEQVLNSNKSLDVGEDAQQMSEPGLIILSILLLLALWFKEKRKIKYEK